MLKTPLPEKLWVKGFQSADANLAVVINQLIDVVAELTEVVEGKQKPKRHYDGGECTCEQPQTLKEQLLGEIKRNVAIDAFNNRVLFEEDVEAIINRLIK